MGSVCKLFILLFLVSSVALATLSQDELRSRQERCKDKLQQKLIDILKQDQDNLLSKQLQLTSLKLAQRVLQSKKDSPELNKSIEAYTEALILGPKLKGELSDGLKQLYEKSGENRTPSDLDNDLQKLYTRFEPSNEEKQLTNTELHLLVSGMRNINKNFANDFSELDEAILWFSDELNEKTATDLSVSKYIQSILANKSSTPAVIAQNIDLLSRQLQLTFDQIKLEVFKNNKEICLFSTEDEVEEKLTNHQTIFSLNSCQNADGILEKSFVKQLDDILSIAAKSRVSILDPVKPDIDSGQPIEVSKRRQIQLEINTKSSDLDRIMAYHKSELYRNQECPYYSVLDKKKSIISVYDNQGKEVLSFDSLVGWNTSSMYRMRDPNPSEDDDIDPIKNPLYSPDAITNWTDYENHITNNTTGAGIFNFISERTPDMNESYQMFGGQLFALDDQVSTKESVMAVHVVPNEGDYIQERLNHFEEDGNRARTGGCINLEGYSYSIYRNYMKKNCPLYVLPQEKEHVFMVKNGKMNFTTLESDKRAGDELNQFNFTPIENTIPNYQVQLPKEAQDISKEIDKILANKELLKRHANSERWPDLALGPDNFCDVLRVSYALLKLNPTQDPIKLFENVRKSYFHEGMDYYSGKSYEDGMNFRAGIHYPDSNFDLLPPEDQRKKIIARYNKDFGNGLLNTDKLISDSNELLIQQE